MSATHNMHTHTPIMPKSNSDQKVRYPNRGRCIFVIFFDEAEWSRTWLVPYPCSSSSVTSSSSSSDRGVLCCACSESVRDLPSWARPRNFSLALKKSMLSALWLDEPSASPRLSKAPHICNSLGLLLSSLGARGRPRGRGVLTGLRGLSLLLVESDSVRSITSESVDPRVRGETSSELLRSGKLRESSMGLCLGTEMDRCVGGPRWARWSSGVGGNMWSEGGGWGRATGTVTATLAELSSLSSGTTVAARGLGRGSRRGSPQSDPTSSWPGESHTPLESTRESLVCGVFVLAESSGSAASACSTATPRKWCKEGEEVLLLWESERPREWEEALHMDSGWSDRSLSEWERHSLLCLCLLWKQKNNESLLEPKCPRNGHTDCTHVFSTWRRTWLAEFPDTPPAVSWRKGLVWWRPVSL